MVYPIEGARYVFGGGARQQFTVLNRIVVGEGNADRIDVFFTHEKRTTPQVVLVVPSGIEAPDGGPLNTDVGGAEKHGAFVLPVQRRLEHQCGRGQEGDLGAN